MTQVSCKTTINMPAHATWQVLNSFGAAYQGLVMVKNCTVEGQGIGALRTLTHAGGTMRPSSAWVARTKPSTDRCPHYD